MSGDQVRIASTSAVLRSKSVGWPLESKRQLRNCPFHSGAYRITALTNPAEVKQPLDSPQRNAFHCIALWIPKICADYMVVKGRSQNKKLVTL